MKGLRTIAAFFLIWLAVAPAVAAVMQPPDLSVIQREKNTQLVFSWSEPVDFSEEIRDGQYFLSFPVQLSGAVGSLDQIRAALPVQWRRMRFAQNEKGLLFSLGLPKNGSALTQKRGKTVLLSFFEDKALIPAEIKTETEEKQQIPSEKVEKPIEKELPSVKTEIKTEAEIVQPPAEKKNQEEQEKLDEAYKFFMTD